MLCTTFRLTTVANLGTRTMAAHNSVSHHTSSSHTAASKAPAHAKNNIVTHKTTSRLTTGHGTVQTSAPLAQASALAAAMTFGPEHLSFATSAPSEPLQVMQHGAATPLEGPLSSSSFPAPEFETQTSSFTAQNETKTAVNNMLMQWDRYC